MIRLERIRADSPHSCSAALLKFKKINAELGAPDSIAKKKITLQKLNSHSTRYNLF